MTTQDRELLTVVQILAAVLAALCGAEVANLVLPGGGWVVWTGFWLGLAYHIGQGLGQ